MNVNSFAYFMKFYIWVFVLRGEDITSRGEKRSFGECCSRGCRALYLLVRQGFPSVGEYWQRYCYIENGVFIEFQDGA